MGVLTAGLATFFLDQTIRDFTQNELIYKENFFTDLLYAVGDRERVFYGALALYSADVIIQNNYFHETLILSTQSLIITQGITEAFKKTFKRARPRSSPDNPFDFFNEGESFFSGHSSGAWSYLTVLAGRHPEIKWLAYGFAGCVSLSRVYEDAHWMSDVIIGSLVGYTIGKLTLQLNVKYTDRILLLPYVDVDGGRFVMLQFSIN